MWRHEQSIETSATAERVWKLFEDVDHWRNWNAGIESIELHGRFAHGATFTMKPPGQDALSSTLIDVRVHEAFTDETWVGSTCVRVSHRLTPLAGGGTKITYATAVTGPDAQQVGSMVCADFPQVLAALKRLAEQ